MTRVNLLLANGHEKTPLTDLLERRKVQDCDRALQPGVSRDCFIGGETRTPSARKTLPPLVNRACKRSSRLLPRVDRRRGLQGRLGVASGLPRR